MGRVVSWSDLLDLCIKHTNRLSRKFKAITCGSSSSSSGGRSGAVKSRKSFVSVVSNKAIKFVQRKTSRKSIDDDPYGDGGVWQRSIMMGDKCQPLDFSGVIYYDNSGKQLGELPLRSPRASPLPAHLLPGGRERV